MPHPDPSPSSDQRFAADGFPAFFGQVAPLQIRDPLAAFLGSAQDGLMTYGYADAVRLAGHSCPTVAGAWLMVVHGLRALYGAEVPVRGEVEVHMRGASDEGVVGVMAQVAQLLTGATTETGFKGLRGRFVRTHLLAYDAGAVQGELALRRVDTGARVDLALDTSVVAWEPLDEMQRLLPLAVAGRAEAAQLARFGQLWQDRVRRMLTEHADDPRLIQVRVEG